MHSCGWHNSFTCVWQCDVNHSYVSATRLIRMSVWHDSFPFWCDMTQSYVSVTWLNHMSVWHDSIICQCDMTHSYVSVTWLNHMSVWHDSFICQCDMTHSYVSVTWLNHISGWHDSIIFQCDMTQSDVSVTWLHHISVWHDSCICPNGGTSCAWRSTYNDPFLCTCRIHMCDMTPAHMYVTVKYLIYMSVWRDVFVYQCDKTHSYAKMAAPFVRDNPRTRLVQMYTPHSWVRHDSYTCVCQCNTTHLYVIVTRLIRMWVRHDAFGSQQSTAICAALLIYMWDWIVGMSVHMDLTCVCDMSHLHVYVRVTWLIHMWDMTLRYVSAHGPLIIRIHMWHDSFMCDITHSNVAGLIHMWHDSLICNATHSYMCHDSLLLWWVMGRWAFYY